MQSNIVKRHVFNGLLTLHFVAIALTVGPRFATFVINKFASADDLRALVFGRELGGELARTLALPGLVLLLVTGVLMVIVRYGRRVPLWVYMKIVLTVTAVGLASPIIAPALEAARYWARWSLDHGYLAPQYKEAAAKAATFGTVVFGLFLLNIPIAVWKPLSGLKASDVFSFGRARRNASSNRQDTVVSGLKASSAAVQRRQSAS